MLMDFAIMSILLAVAHLLRAHIKLLQDLLLPSSILAGLLALVGGPQGLGRLPFHTEAGKPAMTDYPSQLVVVLFATLFLGARPKSPDIRTVLRSAGDTFFYNLAAEIGQFGAALLFGLLLLAPLFPELNHGFALMLPAGFAGGHGTATVIGQALQKQGWGEAVTIGYTFATIGLLVGILGGMLLINLGTRFGWTRLVRSAHELPEAERRGLLPPDHQRPLGRETVSPMALDPLAWHVALVLAVFALSHLLNSGYEKKFPGSPSLPLFAVAMLLGAALQKLLDAVRLGQYVDRQVMVRIGSSASDYLIGFAVASINLGVVLRYALPITVMALFGIAYSVALFGFLGPRICRNFWFERSIFVYGWVTGIVGTGIILLRVVDPRFRSRTLEDYGLAYLFIAPFEIALLVALPPLVARGWIVGPALVLVAGFAVCVVLSAYLVGWYRVPATALREGEQEIIAPEKQ